MRKGENPGLQGGASSKRSSDQRKLTNWSLEITAPNRSRMGKNLS